MNKMKQSQCLALRYMTGSHLVLRGLCLFCVHHSRSFTYTGNENQGDVMTWKCFPHYWPFVRGTTRHCSGPVFCHLLGVSSGCAQPITGQVTSVTCARFLSPYLTHLGLVSYICVMKNSPHFPSDAYMRRKSLYFFYRSRGRPTKQCQAKMS